LLTAEQPAIQAESPEGRGNIDEKRKNKSYEEHRKPINRALASNQDHIAAHFSHHGAGA
jgi:hypothetical protein